MRKNHGVVEVYVNKNHGVVEVYVNKNHGVVEVYVNKNHGVVEVYVNKRCMWETRRAQRPRGTPWVLDGGGVSVEPFFVCF